VPDPAPKMRATTRMKQVFNATRPAILLFPTSTREAKMLEALGYDTFYVGAGAVIGPIIGRPDNGTITLTESVQVSRWFAEAVEIPVWTDTDACFGGIFQVERAVGEFIASGVGAITIEDQPFIGKRFGGMVGKEVIPVDEAAAKFRVAADVRDSLDPDFQIVARCDALTAVNGGGLGAAIDRLLTYQDAGADVLYIEGPRSLDELAAVREAVSGPLTCTPFNLEREITQQEGEQLGLCAVFYLEASRVLKNWHWHFFKSIKDDYAMIESFGSEIPVTTQDLGSLSNAKVMAGLRFFEERYLPEAALRKYEGDGQTTVSDGAERVEH
jgi:2-methylisocitrate lyase-like PEP mutase family enzyme